MTEIGLTAMVDVLALVGWGVGYAALVYLAWVRDVETPVTTLLAVWLVASALGLLAARFYLPGHVGAARGIAVAMLVAAECVLVGRAVAASDCDRED